MAWDTRRVALVLALCAVLAGCTAGTGREQPPSVPPAIEAVRPKGEIAWPFAFEWKGSAPAGTLYRITIYDTVERQLLDEETRAQRLEAPAALRALLSSSRRFLWRVAVVDGSGDVVAQTPPVEFTVK